MKRGYSLFPVLCNSEKEIKIKILKETSLMQRHVLCAATSTHKEKEKKRKRKREREKEKEKANRQ